MLPAPSAPYLEPGLLPGDFDAYEELLSDQERETLARPAAEAKQYELVNELTAPGAAAGKALDMAAQIAGNAPLALAAVKETLRVTEALDDNDAFKRQDEVTSGLASTEDAHEGARAFVERRAPVWHGR
jgi:enoyl-CoA hydratase